MDLHAPTPDGSSSPDPGASGAASQASNQPTSTPTSPPTSPPTSQAELRDLLHRSARGDEAAFAQLYDRTVPRALGLAVQVVRDRAQAEEVVQEAYLEVWKQSARYDASLGSVMTWLCTIVHRRAVDRVRADEASTRRDRSYGHRNHAVDHDVTADTAHASLEAHRVRRALESLTDVQREAVELAYLKGYTHREVADLLDLPVGTAKTRIRDGLIRLRDTLGVGGAR